MEGVFIETKDEKEKKLLRELAKKMGLKARSISERKKKANRKQKVDEITLMSQPALAEDWLHPDDDVYDNL